MRFDTSLIRAAHNFRLVFIRLRYESMISRQQVIFLGYLIENGFVKDFAVRSVMTNGLSWELANQYLKYLKKIGYTSKQGRLWCITDRGQVYYATFMKDLNRSWEKPFSWR